MSTDNSLDQFEPLTFDFIPRLRQLLPTTGGLPGVDYGLVATTNMKPAQLEGWGATTNSKVFTITGPKGKIDVVLVCKGEPVRGISPQSGARRYFIDESIYAMTGLGTDEQAPSTDEPPKAAPKSKSTKPDPFDSLPS